MVLFNRVKTKTKFYISQQDKYVKIILKIKFSCFNLQHLHLKLKVGSDFSLYTNGEQLTKLSRQNKSISQLLK